MDETVLKTARQIRARFIGIILRSAIGVVFATVLAVILLTGIALANSLDFPPFSELPILNRLEGYYVGHGSWDGVSVILQQDSGLSSFVGSNATLLDAGHRIVLDRGASASPNIGAPYLAQAHDVLIDLKVNDQVVGVLVFNRENSPSRLGTVTTILGPVSLVAIIMAMLAVLLVMMLSRRVVNPLAEVIAAARAVSAGKLDTRVQLQGPQDLNLLIDSFNHMAAALERNESERRDLLADIAHELRTPLSGIRGRLEGMLDGIYPATPQYISLALHSTYLLGRLVEDLRILTLAEARQLHFDLKPTDLAALAAHAIEVFSAEAQEKHIQLSLEPPGFPASEPCLALADPQRTEQVIANLVSNALHYVPEGGSVWLTLAKTGETLSLAVNDNGPGIAAEDLPFIFDRFWRKDKSRSRPGGGSGLGLAIARQFIEAQGGAITAHLRPGGGLQIVISLAASKT